MTTLTKPQVQELLSRLVARLNRTKDRLYAANRAVQALDGETRKLEGMIRHLGAVEDALALLERDEGTLGVLAARPEFDEDTDTVLIEAEPPTDGQLEERRS